MYKNDIQLNSLLGSYQYLTWRNNDLENAYRSLNDQVNTMTNDNNYLSGKVRDLENSNSSLYRRISDLESTNSSLYSQVSSLESTNRSLSSQVSSLESTNRELSNEVSKLKQEKKELVNQKFKNEIKEFLLSQLLVIKENIKEDFFEINFYDDKKINQLIEKVSKEENFEKKSFKEIENIVIENSKKNKLVKHLNIILAGPSGVGKSSLINTVLKFSKDECLETAIGQPCTMGEPKYYESNKIPLLRLADTRGIEKCDYQMEDLNKSIDKFIKGKLEEENPDYFVHCIWYCITGTRLEQNEINTLKELSRIYKSNSIPIIVVYTQALSKQKISEMEKFIKSNFTHDFVPVLAIEEVISEDIIIKPYGIDKLKEISISRAKEAVKSSCYEYNILNTKKKIQKILNNLKKSLNLILNNNISEKLKIMNEGKSLEEMYDDLKNLLIFLFSNNLYIGTRKYVSKESENIIKIFSEIYINECIEKFIDYFIAFINKESEKISQVLLDFQNNFNNNNEGLLNNLKDKNQFQEESKKYLEKEISDKALLYCIKNAIKNICSLCVVKFQENSEKVYNQILEKEEFQNIILKLIENDFEEINKNLIL